MPVRRGTARPGSVSRRPAARVDRQRRSSAGIARVRARGQRATMPIMTLTYSVVLDPAEEGGYVVRVPRLPGCVTEGDTLEEAIDNAREAITAYLLSLRDDGQEIPPPDAGGIRVERVAVDPDAA